MTLYEQYCKLELDLARLSLERGDTEGGYFCDPLGAEVIGWAGVDGIHFCFVKGFGEMVFAVSPANGPGEYVHPLARSFEDFLRLVLACGGADAAEQAWMWNRGEFDAFLETYPPNEERQAVLDALAQALSLTPMDDPYGYIRAVQREFDYSELKFGEEYDELVGEPEPASPPERPEWNVYYEGGFWDRGGRGRPGAEIPVGTSFLWAENTIHVPAVYACSKGLVADLCMEIDPAWMRAFWAKWGPRVREGRALTPEEREEQIADNPMNLEFELRAVVNGRETRARHGCGFGWTPPDCVPNLTQDEQMPDWQYYEGLWLLERYGLPTDRCWMFWRQSFPWATRTKPVVKTLSLTLEARPNPVPGPRFTVSGSGDRMDFISPLTGQSHTLQVVEYQEQTVDLSDLPDSQGWDYPAHYTAMAYTVEPELPRKALIVQDVEYGDQPRPKPREERDALAAIGGADGPSACSIGIIGGSDGPAIVMAHAKGTLAYEGPQLYTACSALRFAPPEKIEWRMSFRETRQERVTVELLP